MKPLFFCPPLCWGAAPALAFAGLVYGIVRRRRQSDRSHAAVFVALLVAAAFVELRWLHTFPRLWPQYYLTWGFALAIAFGCAPQLITELTGPDLEVSLPRALAEVASLLGAGTLLMAHLDQIPAPKQADAERWAAISFVQRNLRPGERVWIRSDYHPIGALDASYYWSAFADVVPAMIKYAAISGDARLRPELGDQSLPLCRTVTGEETSLRFLSYSWEDLLNLPETKGCMHTLQAQNRLCGTPFQTPFERLAYLRSPGGTCDLGP
jgi:hypothetical protein